jgi:integrase
MYALDASKGTVLWRFPSGDFCAGGATRLARHAVLGKAAGLRRATWRTFRRTYSSWAHDEGIPPKVVAAIMGHAKVDTTINVDTQVLDGAVRDAAHRELFDCSQPEGRRR